MQILKLWSRMTSSDADYDAVDLLKQDHAVVAELFDRYERLDDLEEKQALISRIVRSLTVHARIEEELFYPALRRASGDPKVMDDADVEHAIVRMIVVDLSRTSADTAHFDAKVRTLAHLVAHHVAEEEAQMFQDARDSDLNLVAMGGQLDAYRAALESRYELDRDGKELEAFLSAPTVVKLAAAPASGSRKPRPKRRSEATSVPGVNGRPRRRIKGISTSQQRRTRKSGRPAAEASEGE
jgi:hemerythrin superfamily protein